MVLTALGAALAVVVLVSCAGAEDSGFPTARVVSTHDEWKTIEYQGVQVEIPAAWTRAATEDCEFQFERWTPPDLPACRPDGGLAFYPSATFDPKDGPGIRRGDAAGGAAAWAGYVYAGDFAVYASGDDRDLIHHVLRSADTSDE